MGSRRRADLSPWLAALVAAAAVAVFSPALLNGFVRWDDDIYLTSNPVFHGPAAAAARWALSTLLYGHYMPLVWLSFALDYALWGLDPGFFHLTNVLLHAAGSVLAFYSLRELLRAAAPDEPARPLIPWAAAAGALFFAVHPLRVESVAWAVERKDVLCGVFWLGSLLAYLRGRPRLSLALFAASLLAKVSGLMLPAALVVLDVYPLRRLPADPRLWAQARWRGVWREKAAFLAILLLGFLVSVLSLRAAGSLHGLSELGPAWRAGHSLYGLWFYPSKTLWPGRLSPYYEPRPWFGRLWPRAALLATGALAAAACGWALRRRAPGVPAAIVAYALLVAPALGALENGLLSAACARYSYLPGIPFAALFAAAVLAAARRRRGPALLAAACVCAAAGAAAYAETTVWRDTASLWSRALEIEPGCGVAMLNLGVARAEEGRLSQAADLFRDAARAGAARPELWEDLGGALAGLGRRDEAIAALRRALAEEPARARSREALGALLARRAGDEAQAGLPGAALRDYRAATAVYDRDGAAQNNFGLLLDGLGRRREARRRYERAISDPGVRALAHYNWGNSFLASGDEESAERHFAQALTLDPGMARAQVNRANILARRGRLAEAAAAYRDALKRDPSLDAARVNLASVERLLRR